MKLRNKKTGEIAVLTLSNNGETLIIMKDGDMLAYDVKLSNLKEWEDYQEPKEYWYIECDGEAYSVERLVGYDLDRLKDIGNYFETEEEAERAVEKLKAWKRLRDKGFRFADWNCALQEINFEVPESFYDRPDMAGEAISEETTKDLDLLFGGEDE